MLRITSDLAVNKLLCISNSINGVSGDKVIVEASSKRFETRCFSPKARLAFAKLKQTFSIALILHHFDLKYHICLN